MYKKDRVNGCCQQLGELAVNWVSFYRRYIDASLLLPLYDPEPLPCFRGGCSDSWVAEFITVVRQVIRKSIQCLWAKRTGQLSS